MTPARKNPCKALAGQSGSAGPAVWDVICKHGAAPWHHASPHTEKLLVVSSFALAETYDQFLETIVELSAFEPESMPPASERASLAQQDPSYLARQPQSCGAFPQETGEAIVLGLSKMIGTHTEIFFELLQTWTAVHANFLASRYRAGAAYGNAPYFIADTVHISSCCVELF